MMPCTRMPCLRHTIVRSAALALLLAAPASIVSAKATSPIAAFISKTCVDCHGPDAQEGGVRLDTLPLDAKGLAASPESLHTLIRVHDRVRDGEMPPKDVEQPSAADRQAFVAAVAPTITAGETEAAAGTGRTTIRRLNRAEYEHTLRDLFSLPSLRVKDLLPEDARRENFDKVAGGLDISYVQMAKYLEAAGKALHQSVVKSPQPPKKTVWRENAMDQWSVRGAVNQKCLVPMNGHELAPGYVTGIAGDPVNNAGNSYRWAKFDDKAESAAVLTGVIGAHQPEGIQIDRFNPPTPGLYKVRFSIWGLRWVRTKAEAARPGAIVGYQSFDKPFFQDDNGKWQATPADDEKKNKPNRTASDNLDLLASDGEVIHVVRASLRGRPLGYFDALSLKPTVHEFTVWLAPDDRISFHAMTLPASGPQGGGVNDGVRDYEGPGIAYDWFEVEGPLDDSWPPPSQRRLFGTTPIDRFPRPPVADRPTVGESPEPVAIPLADFRGAGQRLDSEWLLNVTGDITTTVNVAKPGSYELRVTAYQTPAGDDPAEACLLVRDQVVPHGRAKVTALRDAPQTIAKRFTAAAGPVTVGVRFPNDFLDEKTAADRNLAVTKVEVAPVKVDDAATTEAPEPAALLRDFATASFRRPVAEEEVAPYARIVSEQLAHGEHFQDAMFAGYRAILCAPDFLLVGLESGLPKAGGPAAPLGAHALASRLSYFLWDSLPDQALLDLAASGDLLEPDVLADQVDRMLDDPKSERFVEHFLDEWLKLHEIDFTTPDPKLYPDFDPWLRDSMLAETRATFRRLLAEDRPVAELIDSDTVMINQRLAILYGIPNVHGAAIRPCPVPEGVPRGGLLTQASVHKVTANGTATSPVLRGVWAMERLLGIPRLPPPPNIPAIEPDATGATTIRQMVEMHRADNACAVCHARMDPYGLALEAFDPIGGHRDRYRISGQPKKVKQGKEMVMEPSVEVVTFTGSSYRNRVNVRVGSEVDASGTLADGRSFRDVEELKKLLLADPEAIATNVARQLTIYATGSPIRFSDRDEIDRVVAATKSGKHGLRTLVKQVVLGDLFRSK
jgi:mono/diheme cytochrome c family protein